MLTAPSQFTLVDQLVQTSESFPEKRAFECADQQLSYAQLLQQSRQLSDCLDACGVKHQESVALLLPRCLETSVAIFASFS